MDNRQELLKFDPARRLRGGVRWVNELFPSRQGQPSSVSAFFSYFSLRLSDLRYAVKTKAFRACCLMTQTAKTLKTFNTLSHKPYQEQTLLRDEAAAVTLSLVYQMKIMKSATIQPARLRLVLHLTVDACASHHTSRYDPASKMVTTVSHTLTTPSLPTVARTSPLREKDASVT